MPTAVEPTWLRDLEEHGYCVVPDAVPRELCEEFCEEAWSWLEGFPYGFKRDDRSTWTAEHMPYGFTGGLYNRYAVNHESWMWKIRVQPGITKAFAKVWGTNDLIASFDGMNATLPINKKYGRSDLKETQPWPHIDQNPKRIDRLELCQGIANLSDNGPDDGGLVVVRGSHKLHEEYFSSIGGVQAENDFGEELEGYDYSMKDVEWYLQRGCEIVKTCAKAGDLILFDSRTIHWNASPVGKQTRFVQYVAYSPRSCMSEEDLAKKLQIFKDRKGTTGWANKNVVPEDIESESALPRRPDGSVDQANRTKPISEPLETPNIMWAVGVRG